jgi:alkaline phosphatase D
MNLIMYTKRFESRSVAAGSRRWTPRGVLLVRIIGAALVAGSGSAAVGDGFSLGVAAGDVRDSAAVLWTRADSAGVVRWELARDESFATLEQSGTALAVGENDLVVRVELTELSPAADYYYRFSSEGATGRISGVGRFQTAPAPDEAAALRFVFSGDTGITWAPFGLASPAAREGADFFLWFGDTMYADHPAGAVDVATTLDEYREKYREIRGDPHIQEALAAMPIWVGWDDHEVENDYAGADPTLSLEQREAAYRAFLEYMPVEDQRIVADPFRTYRSFRWGSQVEFFLLDGRQYREPSAEQLCSASLDPYGTLLGPLLADESCVARLSEERTMLGEQQLDWLTQGLRGSTAAVKFVINNVPLSFIGILPYDRWDGYDAERRALLEFIDANEIEGAFFLTTDFHSNWYNPDVLRYFRGRRPDYDLPNNVRVAEAIVGPLGIETLHETVVGMAARALGQPDGPVIHHLLAGVERHFTQRLQCVGGFTLIEANRYSYAVVDVSPSGEVEINYRGVAPADAQNPDVEAETFYTARDDPPPSLPCCVLVILAGLTGWPVLGRLRVPARG